MITCFLKFLRLVENEQFLKITTIHSDHGGEFENECFEEFCDENGYRHNFLDPQTPQKNVVVVRKIRSLQEMARTMLLEFLMP